MKNIRTEQDRLDEAYELGYVLEAIIKSAEPSQQQALVEAFNIYVEDERLYSTPLAAILTCAMERAIGEKKHTDEMSYDDFIKVLSSPSGIVR